MDKKVYKKTSNKTKYVYRPNNLGNIKLSKSPIPNDYKNFEEEIEFFSPISSQDRPGRIIHQSTEQSFDEQGNRVIKTKTVREINTLETNNRSIQSSRNSKGIMQDNQPREKYFRVSKYSRTKNEAEKQKALYSSPDFQGTSPYESPIYMKDIKNSNDLDEVGYNTNYRYESKNINGKKIGEYEKKERYEYVNKIGNRYGSEHGSPEIEIISPVGYVPNYSSGSEFDESQMRSLDNYHVSGRNQNQYNINERIKKSKNLNYELEDPEGFDYLRNNELNGRNKYNNELNKINNLNRSENKKRIIDDSYRSDHLDFQSPERNIKDANKFRNVTVGMIDSKGPTNDDRKVTKIMKTKTENITKNKIYKTNIPAKPKNEEKEKPNNLSKIEAAKIIQAWWRRRYAGEEEVYDITVKKAIKLQSFIRGFLVRKKVLRYITLAIYYQSFCDKLQDVLCNNVKKEIFKYFKEKFLNTNQKPREQFQKNSHKEKQENAIYNNRRLKKIPINKKNDINNENNIIKKEMVITRTNKVISQQNKPQNIPQNRINQSIKTSYTQSSLRTNQYPQDNISPMSYQSPVSYCNRTQIIRKSPDPYENRDINRPVFQRTPDTYYQDRINSNYYNKNVNKSFDNSINNREKIVNIRYIKRNNSKNHYYDYRNYNRDDINEERERNISPTFGILQNKKTTQKYIITDHSDSNFNNRRRKIVKKSSDNIDNITTTTKRTKKIITSSSREYVKKTGNKTKNQKIKKIPIRTNKNEMISGGTLSIIKLPNRKIKNSESEGVYTNIKKKRIIINKNIENENQTPGFVPANNSIDNQLSIGIVRTSHDDYEIRNKRVREEFITYEEPKVQDIKEIIKEKVIIKKESKPETAEEGNDRQNFDMIISKNVAMSIEASTESKEIIKNEQKEIEIFKKREREKNKEIDKYKEDFENQKLKNKYDTLKHVIKIIDYWKKRILKNKFDKYKNNAFSGPNIYEMETGKDFQIIHRPKEKKDFSTQFTTEKVDEGAQVVIKDEDDEKKKIKNFGTLKISKNRTISFDKVVKKKPKVEHKITKSKLKILSNKEKKEFGQQSEPWETKITKIKSSINIIPKKKERVEEGSQYTNIENKIGQTKQIQIIQNKPELIDSEVQHEYPDNCMGKELNIEIKGIKPNLVESDTQYEKSESKIIKSTPLSIKGIPKKEIIKKVETIDAQCNTFNETVEQGINAVIEEEPKPKNIEVKIRTVKRSLHELEIPLLKKLWKRKAFRTFCDNCKRPAFHKILGRELLRMAFLRWRFIKGYGPDRYGNAYDRDGNLLYKTKGKVADMEVQQEFVVEKEEESTQYIPIENVIFTLKRFEIGAAYKKKIVPEKVDQAVGDNIKIAEVIQKGETINYKYQKKERPLNKISENNHIEIKKIEKKLKDEGTEMPKPINKITNLEKINISNDEYKLRNKNKSRMRELLIQMVYRKMMGDKLTLSDALRKWLKQTILLLQNEQNELDKKKRSYSIISKAERFAFIDEIKKIESGTQMEAKKNKVEKIDDFNVIIKKRMKNAEINVNIPFIFDIEKIKPQNENKISYKSNKKPLILQTNKENDINIYSYDYLFREEIKKGIHHPMTEEGKKRVKEILIKYFETRGSPNSVLRKYFTIWYRKARYLSCLDNARIISEFCKRNLNRYLNFKKWNKLCEKIILKEKLKIVKSSKIVNRRRNKIFDLIRLTRLNTVYAKRRYLHYIILCWLIYTRNINKKRAHIKTLYENMLNTYMHMADDVFGNNQKENPSIQDALFEAVDSDKFQTKELKDVPLAQSYYETKKDIKKVTTNITYINKEEQDLDSKEYITYKTFVSKHPIPAPTTNGSGNIKIIKKVVKVGDGERLQSRGRGRKYRTKVEKEILNKFYEENRNYSKNKEKIQKEENEENLNEKKFDKRYVENKNIKIEKSEDVDNSLEKEEIKNLYNNKDMKKKETTYSERRKYFAKYNDEDQKELDDED